MHYQYMKKSGVIALCCASLLFAGCGGGNSSSGAAGGGAITVTTPAVNPVGTQVGGARQGVELTLTAEVSLYAGGLFYGSTDGVGSDARFSSPIGITTDGSSLYVADSANNLIRKIDLSNSAVTTIAGGGSGYNASYSLNYAKPGSLDGVGVAASFSNPSWITSDGANLYITDAGNYKIRKIVIATGLVSTFAGTGTSGSVDGIGTSASFSALKGITTDGTNLYVVDDSKIRIVAINTGLVSTKALVDSNGAPISVTGVGITTDGSNLYVSDVYTIRKIVIASGVTTILAGNLTSGCHDVDGIGTAASFCNPRGMTSDGVNLYVAGNESSPTVSAFVRKVVLSTGAVTTLAGGGAQWDTDGTGTAAGFRLLKGITTDGVGLYVLDASRVRKIR